MQETCIREKVIWSCIVWLGLAVVFAQVVSAFTETQEVPYVALSLSMPEEPSAASPVMSSPLAEPLPDHNPVSKINGSRLADLLVDAIIQVESMGNPHCVGLAGERGLMQIKNGTWNDATRELYGKRISFDKAFDPDVNRKVGKAYLKSLQAFIIRHKAEWASDERSLLLACYNAGPGAVRRSGFDPAVLPASTRSYIHRATALHELYVEQEANRLGAVTLLSERRETRGL